MVWKFWNIAKLFNEAIQLLHQTIWLLKSSIFIRLVGMKIIETNISFMICFIIVKVNFWIFEVFDLRNFQIKNVLLNFRNFRNFEIFDIEFFQVFEINTFFNLRFLEFIVISRIFHFWDFDFIKFFKFWNVRNSWN